MPGISRALQQEQQLDRTAVAAINDPGTAPTEHAQAAGAERFVLCSLSVE